tara:strand:+ start:399 stop:1544 length:1146 start_codon:yes stop_codon:yes gene_type:complete
MIKFTKGAGGSEFDEIQKEHENSQYKILVFDWWDWLWSQPGWPSLNDHDYKLQTNLSTDGVIAEVKEYDICFFVIREVLNTGVFDIIPKVLNNMLIELDNLNVFYITLSEDSNFPTDESKTFNIPWFITSGENFYTSKNTTIDFDYRPKDFTFNLLLGSERQHRTQIFETLHSESYIYPTYLGHKDFRLKSAGHLEDEDIWNNLTNQNENTKLDTTKEISRPNSQKNRAHKDTPYNEDRKYWISHIIPESIYNNSHFDIISESQPLMNTLKFNTEKTGKPLSTGRFFIWFDSPHKLEYLRKFGFELQDYLCEYDSIIDGDNRLETIFELIKEIGDNENYIKSIYKDTKSARINNQEVFNELSKTTESNLSSWIRRQVNRKL